MSRKSVVVSLMASFVLVAGCQSSGSRRAGSGGGPPLFPGMGDHHRKVTTSSARAQRYFDQGLTFSFAFNHDEAIRSFTEAARLDPGCAMAWWGVALCNGPHINNPVVPEERAVAAWEALGKAEALKDGASPVERALIDALAKRYASPPAADRKALDEAYARAMRDVWHAHPSDADIGTLFAESMMDLRPWDLWTKDGRPQPGTEEILAALEEALRRNPAHPGANHLYIHAVESSPHPEKAAAAADRLRDLVPGAGHLVHMPAHIDVRTGQWKQSAEANEKAIKADRRYRELSPVQGFYHVYMAHNHHFLSYASMMEGRGAAAEQAARDMIAGVPQEFIENQGGFVDPYMMIAMEALMRFGRWDDLLAEPSPPAQLPITSCFRLFTRGVAYAAKGQIAEAEREQATFRAAVAKLPPDAMMAINPASKVLAIADHVLAGEIAYRRGNIDEAVTQLRAGVKLEDDLRYMEPPDWIQPVRHTLGAVLLDAGRYEEAEAVYLEDLARWPENGWSLFGLSKCLKQRGAAEAAAVEAKFKKAWARADVTIGSSCLCVKK